MYQFIQAHDVAWDALPKELIPKSLEENWRNNLPNARKRGIRRARTDSDDCKPHLFHLMFKVLLFHMLIDFTKQ
uniref:Uncharacterized protein n=1 Tax=Ditylenchus dipsaci TaxID=166011 RepID=A0A915E8C2_9BILA